MTSFRILMTVISSGINTVMYATNIDSFAAIDYFIGIEGWVDLSNPRAFPFHNRQITGQRLCT